MKVDFAQDITLSAMEQYMTRLSKRQQVIASNLANIDTPGYRTKDISFHATIQDLLANQAVPLRTTRPEHLPLSGLSFTPLEPEVLEVQNLPARGDLNNVDRDRELLRMSETTFGYSLMAQLLRGKFRTLASSINDGRIG
jgi:flagellar basal-body rod protein FlgB